MSVFFIFFHSQGFLYQLLLRTSKNWGTFSWYFYFSLPLSFVVVFVFVKIKVSSFLRTCVCLVKSDLWFSFKNIKIRANLTFWGYNTIVLKRILVYILFHILCCSDSSNCIFGGFDTSTLVFVESSSNIWDHLLDRSSFWWTFECIHSNRHNKIIWKFNIWKPSSFYFILLGYHVHIFQWHWHMHGVKGVCKISFCSVLKACFFLLSFVCVTVGLFT